MQAYAVSAFELVNQSIRCFIYKQLTPSSLAYKLKYAILIESGSAEGAWPGIEKAIGIYPDYVDLHFYKGVVLHITERYEEAREAFLHCLELGDSNLNYLTMKGTGSFLALYYQGLCEEKLEQLVEAEECYKAALAHFPNYQPAIEALSRLEREKTEAIEPTARRERQKRMRVLLASPIRQKPDILGYFLNSLKLLDKDGLQVGYLFVDDNEDLTSRQVLEAFHDSEENVTIHMVEEGVGQPYYRDEITHYWNEVLVDKVAAMKDGILAYSLENGYDAVFLIDSDLLLHTDTLQRLVAANKPVISNIFWTRWQKDSMQLPQVWMSDEYAFFQKNRQAPLTDEEATSKAHEFLAQMRIPGIYEVGGLGACTLIAREVIEKGVRFKRLPNLSFWGEDRHFCIRAASFGFSLYVDTSKPAYHIYRDSDLEGADLFLRSLQGTAEPVIPEEPSIKISLCMIVRDEEESIERCLTSVRGIADEIIIMDTGSTDRTKEIVSRFTDQIYDFEWIDDFGAARNAAFSKATKDYILWLDADDVFEDKDRELFLELKRTLDTRVDSVMMHYVLAKDSAGNPVSSLKRNRLVKRSRGFRWIGAVHEYLEVGGHIAQSEVAVTHKKERSYTDRNLRIYRSRQAKGEEFSPRDVYYFANELRDHAFYEEAVHQYEKFLYLKQGWVEDCIAACMKQADCYGQMYERDNQLKALLRSFGYTLPRAEICCRVGAFFMADKRWQEAIYWYETATKLGAPPSTGTLIDHASWTWLPHLQLCVCYDKLGNLELANEHNEKALAMEPEHPSLLYNRKYFQGELTKRGGEGADVG